MVFRKKSAEKKLEDEHQVISELTQSRMLYTRSQLINALIERCGYSIKDATAYVYKRFPPLD